MNLIDRAFSKMNRREFLPEEARDYENIDAPLPIGYDQTNSQPTTVRLMLEWLDPQKGDKVLDVGSGSGWTTALLAHIVGSKGFIYGVEIIPELVNFGRENVRKSGIRNAEFFQTGSVYGLPDYAPYDRILVSASARHVPDELLAQLKIGGKMVIPVNHDILEITKSASNKQETITHSGFVFVPLI